MLELVHGDGPTCLNIFLYFGIFPPRDPVLEARENHLPGRSSWRGIWFLSLRRLIPDITGSEKPRDQRGVLRWHCVSPSRDSGMLLLSFITFSFPPWLNRPVHILLPATKSPVQSMHNSVDILFILRSTGWILGGKNGCYFKNNTVHLHPNSHQHMSAKHRVRQNLHFHEMGGWSY